MTGLCRSWSVCLSEAGESSCERLCKGEGHLLLGLIINIGTDVCHRQLHIPSLSPVRHSYPTNTYVATPKGFSFLAAPSAASRGYVNPLSLLLPTTVHATTSHTIKFPRPPPTWIPQQCAFSLMSSSNLSSTGCHQATPSPSAPPANNATKLHMSHCSGGGTASKPGATGTTTTRSKRRWHLHLRRSNGGNYTISVACRTRMRL